MIVPIECCTIPGGQVIRKKLHRDMTKNLVRLAAMKPYDRQQSIRAAPYVLRYVESQYIEVSLYLLHSHT